MGVRNNLATDRWCIVIPLSQDMARAERLGLLGVYRKPE
jgi:hypothetical protein